MFETSSFLQNPLFINNNGTDDTDQPPLFDPRGQTQTLFKVQLYVCSILGLICFLIFCFFRYKFPLIFSVRSYRNKKIKKLPNDMFSWVKILISINNEQLLQVIGLESYVFLCFFRMSIKILLSLSILGLCILSPVRYFMTGSFDKDNTTFAFITNFLNSINNDNNIDENSEPLLYLAICTFFTYIFTVIIYWFLFKETNHIIKTRQKFLGSQRSLTDRTIFIKNIPSNMCNEIDLKNHIQELGVGKVDQISFVYDYTPLVKLFLQRDKMKNLLEVLYSKSCGLEINMFKSIDVQSVHLKSVKIQKFPTNDNIIYDPNTDNTDNDNYYVLANSVDKKFSSKKRSCFEVKKSDKELLNLYSRNLIKINNEINHLKDSFQFKREPLAFVTMDSVTDAQMAAQAVFSPKVFELITELAPAPLDINWNNLLLNNKTVFLRKNIIEFIIIVFSCLLIIPIRYITSLLNVNSIRKISKEFGDYLIKHDKVRTVVTGLLPTYLFSLINTVLPYVISLLSSLQGLGSKGDVELSVIKKNFLYIFFNLFLVFTLFGTLSSYKALLTDTTKIAPLLATSIKSLSLFYIDLILLQGLTMFPFKLLQIGDLFFLFWNFIINYKSKTPRLFKDLLYQPQIFDLGLILPQHIMIFIITILYSSISTKILVSGLVYFILGFYTYKYQLVYSLVHPSHSTGKAWPIIFKRICLGVFFLHLQMFGSLALEHSFILAGFMLPLFPTTVLALMFFDRNYKPLLHYIALDAINTRGKSVDSEDENNDLNSLLMGSLTTQDNSNNNDNNSKNDNVQRKNSLVSLNHFLNGNEECDAVIMTSSNESLADSNEIDEHAVTFDEAENSNNHIEQNDSTVDNTINQSILKDKKYQKELDKNTISSIISFNNSKPSLVSNPKLDPFSFRSLSPIVNRKCSTIEEAREATQSYIHPCLLDEMDGIIIGFGNTDIDFLNFKFNNDSDLNIESENSGQSDVNNAVFISEIGSNQENNNETSQLDGFSEGDIEVAQKGITGYVTRRSNIKEVW